MTASLAEHWKRCKKRIQQTLNEENAAVWLTPLELESISAKRVILAGVPNAFFKSRIKFQFATLLKDCLSRSFPDILENDFHLELRIGAPNRKAVADGPLILKQASPSSEGTAVSPEIDSRPKFFFAQFVEHHSNRLALRAAREVALSPGSEYNPLFICAGVGMGKTHLLSAIATATAAAFPKWRIVHETADKRLPTIWWMASGLNG